MPRTPGKGHEALRRGRWSQSGAEYFLTLCTNQSQEGLTAPAILAAISDQLAKLEIEHIWHVRTATIMPDHIHLLVALGESTELSDAIRLFKGRLSPTFRSAGLQWEKGYFDHRTRANEDQLPVFLYIFLNPYREHLVSIGQTWPGYVCAKEDWLWFGDLTDTACPFPEWLV